jgi:hypothetical protein
MRWRSCKPLGQICPSRTQATRGGHPGLRELRPRRGRSPWRALYRRLGDRFVIAAIAPEGKDDPRGFTQGCTGAAERLAEVKEE